MQQHLFAQIITIQGTVTDATTKSPLQAAAVLVAGVDPGMFTDEFGRFEMKFDTISQKQIRMAFSYVGYVAESRTIDLTDSQNRELTIELQPEGFSTDDVVITATKGFEQKQSDVPVSIAVVKPRSIDLQATPNIEKVISQIPGVDNQDGQINIRGSSGFALGVGSRVMVTLDGLPLLTGDAGQATLELIPVDNIAQVEVMKGASSVLYGSSALGGVINVITADPGEVPKTRVRVRGALYDTPRNPEIDWDGDGRAWEGSAHIFHARKIGPVDLTLQTDFIKDSGYRQGTDTEQFRGLLLTKFRPRSVPGLTIGLNASTRIDSSGQILYWCGYKPTQSIENGDTVICHGGLSPTLDSAGLRKQLSQYFALDPSIKYLTPGGNLFWYRGRFLRNTNANSTNQSSKNYIFYNDFIFQTTLAKRINWVSGATYTYQEANGENLYDGRHPGNLLGVYTQMDAKFGKLNTSLGFRYETVQIDTLARESQPIARVGLNYEIAKGTNVRASFGQAFRVPSVAERFTNTSGGGIPVRPNPSIKSERGYSMEAGFRQGYRFKGPRSKFEGYLDIAAFQMNFDDMIEFGVGVDLSRLEIGFSTLNVADARIRGLEITGMNAWSWGNWYANLSGGITLTDPVDLNAVPEEEQLDLTPYSYPDDAIRLVLLLNDPMKADRPRTLKFRSKTLVRTSLSLGYGPVGLTTNFRYRSFVESIDQFLYPLVPDLKSFRDTHPNGNRVTDFILNVDLSRASTLSLTVDNAFNEEYYDRPGLSCTTKIIHFAVSH